MKFRELTTQETKFVTGGGHPASATHDARWGPGADESEENIADGYYQDYLEGNY